MPPTTQHEKDWVTKALCRGAPSGYFAAGNAREAKQVCATCPVLEECRQLCDTIEESLGISDHNLVNSCGMWVWGGELPRERVARRRAA